MIYGDRIYLCAVEEKNIEQLRIWRNSEDLRKYFREYREIDTAMQKKWYYERVSGSITQVDFEIHIKDTGKLIGHCGLYYIHPIYRSGELTIYVGDFTERNKGYGTNALKTLLQYGFDQLNLNRISAEVYTNNNAVRVYQKVGFIGEGVLRQSVFKDGKYLDSIMLSMLRSDYEIVEWRKS